VIAVHPGYVQAYSPSKYISALKLSADITREKKTQNIVSMLKPVKTMQVPPYRSEEIIEKTMKKLNFLIDPFL
jgi:hypothetical protein